MSGKQMRLKILLLGDMSVGKTSILTRYIHNQFSNFYQATIGNDFQWKEITIDGITIKLQIWDPSGQERFKSITRSFYRGCDCCLLVFDVNDPKSFQNLEMWIEDVRNNSDTECPFLVLGNKSDCRPRKVSKTEAYQWCGERNLYYTEVSAKESKNINKVFETAAYLCIGNGKKIEMSREFPASFRVESEKKHSFSSCYCCFASAKRMEYEKLQGETKKDQNSISKY